MTSSFLRCGFDPLKVDRIFISHTHSDHVCELTLFIQLIYLSKRTEPLSIFLPDEFVNPFRTYLNAVYLFEEKLGFKLEITGYEDGFIYQDAFTLNAVANNHFMGHAEFLKQSDLPNRMQCHSFRVTTGSTVLFYSADVGGMEDIKNKLNGVNLAIVEATHCDARELMELVRQKNVSHLIITHLGDSEQVSQIRNIASDMGMSDIVQTAEDGKTLTL